MENVHFILLNVWTVITLTKELEDALDVHKIVNHVIGDYVTHVMKEAY